MRIFKELNTDITIRTEGWRPFRSVCILLTGLVILSRTVLAQEVSMPVVPKEETEVLKLSDLVEKVRRDNPDVRAAFKNYQASENLFKQAVLLDDPRITAGYFAESVETRVGPQRGKYGISQKIPFPGKLALKGRIALRDRDIAYQKYKAVEREAVKELKHAYFDLYWVRRSIAITKEIKNLMDSLEKVAESKYSTGIASQQDVLKAQVEISKLMAKLYTLSEEETTLKEKINTLLNRPVETPLGGIERFSLTKMPYKLDELIASAEKHRQELKAASLNMEKDKNIVTLKKDDYFPDLTLGVDYIDIGSGHTRSPDDGKDAWMGMVSVNVPLWLGRIKAGVNEARDKLDSSRDTYRSVRNSVAFQIKDTFFKLKTAKDLVDLYGNALVPQARESLKASQTGYETGKVDFLSLIDAERVLLNFRIALARAKADHEMRIADLERAVGTGIEDLKGIDGGKNEK